MAITREELALWIKYIYDASGISLDESKGYLIETRFSGLLKETGAASLSDLYRKVKADTSHLSLIHI